VQSKGSEGHSRQSQSTFRHRGVNADTRLEGPYLKSPFTVMFLRMESRDPHFTRDMFVLW